MLSAKILEAAKTIRQFLPNLLEGQASEFDQQLAALINRHLAGEPLGNQITSLLASNPETRKWMRDFLSIDSGQTRGGVFNPLPGLPNIDAPRYICPEKDYIWHHIDSSDPIPRCPTHNFSLVRDES
ncbi:hypothetical protein D0962_26915 [Leptolyngbyaceae cyanobacterium CCMR0082]|uniref:Uncharacterized protein n=1 Tax=Adonisia turfae CCMR0082 TaxID=2304604 RepID=A0A6M0SCX9_9CYAN|nr:hypothetical protein [Adonisia turfae]NEZ66348.1 hypothetical protein [Adonisia turfae CCMR0082]